MLIKWFFRGHTLGEFVASKSDASSFNKKKSNKNRDRNLDVTGSHNSKFEESSRVDNIDNSPMDLDFSSKSVPKTHCSKNDASQPPSQENKDLKK